MDTKKLRQKILDLAIHGKLVPQDPSDEPASVLLERIRTEKERLIKEGKIKRSRKSAKTSDTRHYENDVPEGWVTTVLDELATFGGGKTPSMDHKEYWNNGKYLWITSKDMKFAHITDSILKISDIALEEMTTYGKGTLLMVTRSGILRHTLPIAILDVQATVNQDIKTISCYVHEIHKYLYYAIKAQEAHILENYHKDGTTVDSIDLDRFKKLSIHLPPLSEQQRIVEEIERWFALIDAIEQGKVDLQTTIKQAKSKILDLAIHGKLVQQNPNDEPASELLKRINPKAQIPCDNEHSEKLPQGWCTCRLKDISIIITGSTPSKSNPNYYGGDVPFYKPADLDAGRFLEKSMEHVSEAGKKISRVVPMGSTAVCCIGSIGKVGYLTQEGITNQQINSAIPSEAVNSLFLYYTCASPSFYNELQLLSSAVTISIINKSKMENIKVSLPPLLEQKCIVKKIEELFTVLDTIEQSLQA